MRISDWSSDVCSSDLHSACESRRSTESCWRLRGLGLMPRTTPGAERVTHVGHVQPGCSAVRASAAYPPAVTLMWWRSDSVSASPSLGAPCRSEEHTSDLQSLMRISYAVFCLKKPTQVTLISFHYELVSYHPNHCI